MTTPEYTIDKTEHWFDVEDSERSPEQRLWLAVLMRTMLDAVGCTNVFHPTAHEHAVCQAQRFYVGPSAAYMRTCSNAAVNGRQLRSLAIPIIRQYQETGRQPEFATHRRRTGRRKAA